MAKKKAQPKRQRKARGGQGLSAFRSDMPPSVRIEAERRGVTLVFTPEIGDEIEIQIPGGIRP